MSAKIDLYTKDYFEGQKSIERYAPFSVLAPLTRHNTWQRSQVLSAIRTKERRFAERRAEIIVAKLYPVKTLDVGTATGELVSALLKKKIDAWGAEGSLDIISSLPRSLAAQVAHAYANKLPFENNEFDVVTAYHLLEHIAEAELAENLREMARVSRHYLLFEFPTTRNPWSTVDKTHISLFPDDWWLQKFVADLPDWQVIIYRSSNLTRAMQVTLRKH